MAELIFKGLKTDQKNVITIGAIEVQVTYPDGKPASGQPYELTLKPTGGTRNGTLDGSGRLEELNIPAGAKGELRVGGAPIIAQAE